MKIKQRRYAPSISITIRFYPDELKYIDSKRKDRTRSEFVREKVLVIK
jgi:hypothetical protein